MPRSYRHIKDYEREIIELKEKGTTNREICEKFGFTKKQLEGFITRYNNNQKKLSAGIAIKPKGRPRKDGTVLPPSVKIRECQEKCGRTYGYRRGHLWLHNDGIDVDTKTVLRVMQKYNLLSTIRRKKYRNYGNYLHRYENLLNRDFYADRPNQKWVTDISYIKTKQWTSYFSIIRDLYDNSIVA